jgi:hypothetical protein
MLVMRVIAASAWGFPLIRYERYLVESAEMSPYYASRNLGSLIQRGFRTASCCPSSSSGELPVRARGYDWNDRTVEEQPAYRGERSIHKGVVCYKWAKSRARTLNYSLRRKNS